MPCITLPLPTIPEIPAPLSLGIVTPAIAFNPQLCCKLPPILNIPPIPLGITVNPAIIATINQYVEILNSYLHSLPLDCPRELQQAINEATA